MAFATDQRLVPLSESLSGGPASDWIARLKNQLLELKAMTTRPISVPTKEEAAPSQVPMQAMPQQAGVIPESVFGIKTTYLLLGGVILLLFRSPRRKG